MALRPRERQEKILTWIAQHGERSVPELAELLKVSEMTIRRDLRALQQAELLDHVVGGAELRRSATELTFEVKRRLYFAEKQAIAQKALEMVEPEMTIGFSAGTTTWAIAHRMQGFSHMTFVTNSTNIALELQQRGFSQIILSGGNFRTPSDALVGPFAEYTIRHLHTDLLFLGVHGLDADDGISTPNVQEAAVDQALIQQAQRVVVVMDHTKWGVKALAHIAPIEKIHAVITTDIVSAHGDMDKLRRRGVDVVTVLSPGDMDEGVDHV